MASSDGGHTVQKYKLETGELLSSLEFRSVYLYFGDDEWAWDTLPNRTYYWEKRREAREHRRRASFMPGFAIINRIISVVDVLLFKEEEKFGLDAREGRIGIVYRF